MIGKISIGKSFKGCLLYCLEDKKMEQSQQLVMKNRAEVLVSNLCFGNNKELIQQFNEVRALNSNLSKPVLHITLSLNPGENLLREKLVDMVEDCARQMGFEKNQYTAIHHNDTNHQHLHIVANRVGFDGRTVKDNHNYQKISDYCRKMELKYELKQVLSPRRYLSRELRQVPRLDIRKENLRQHINECLSTSSNYPDFEVKIRQRGYEVIKARGISFQDKQKVKVKGSELDYSLQTIEKLLELKPELRLQVLKQKQQKHQQQLSQYLSRQQQKQTLLEKHRQRTELLKPAQKSKELKEQLFPQGHRSLKEAKILEILLKPQAENNPINPHLLKKKKQKRQSQHL